MLFHKEIERLLLFLFLHLFTINIYGQVKESLMAIFAHPDDELTVAPVLNKYVREGHKVYLVIATDGRLGTNDFSGLQAGDGLAAIRRKEMHCSAEHLGVELIHLQYHDQLKAGEGYDGHMPVARSLIKEIHGLVSKHQPNVLITFGPDGGSNHMDHRLIGSTVTSVFLSQKWERTKHLFFVGTPASKIRDLQSRILRGVRDDFLNVRISFNQGDLENAIRAISCHTSQFQVEQVDAMFRSRYAQKEIHFREFSAPTGNHKRTLF